MPDPGSTEVAESGTAGVRYRRSAGVPEPGVGELAGGHGTVGLTESGTTKPRKGGSTGPRKAGSTGPRQAGSTAVTKPGSTAVTKPGGTAVRQAGTPEGPETGSAEAPESVPLYLRLERKETRLREDQIEALSALRRRLSRRRNNRDQVLTDNTLIRVAVDLLLAGADRLRGDTEAELRKSVGL